MSEGSSKSQRLEQVLADYLEALETAAPLNREELIAQHPELAADLRSFFRNRDEIAELAEPLQAAAGSAETPTTGLEGAVHDGVRRVRYFGDYELLEEIARGGMGVVYKARQTSLGRTVAVKMILAGQLASEGDVQRFRREAEAAANLDHPHIVPIYEIGTHEGQHYFSMRFIAGASVRAELVALRGDLPRAVRMLAAVARAVHHAHQRGVLHRDLKPSNILLDAEGAPHVTDFGLAKQVAAEESAEQPANAGRSPEQLTRSGDIVGTPSYMSPEQAIGAKQLTTAVDVYSLGAILYELLTGQPPFRGATPMETLLAVIDREPESPSRIDARVDRDLETIALKCLDKDPARRYDSAAALADDLDRWLRGEPIEARPADTAERAWRWCRRNPVVASLLALVAISLVTGTVISTLFGLEAQRQAADADVARQKAVTSEQTALYSLYLSRVAQAMQQWHVGEMASMQQTLEAEIPKDAEQPDMRGFEWHFLHRLANSYEKSLADHRVGPGQIEFSRDGRYFATGAWTVPKADGSDSREVIVWEAKTCRKVLTLDQRVHLATFYGVWDLSFSPDSRFLAVVDGGASSLAAGSPDFPAGVKVFSIPDGKLAGALAGADCVAFSPDGTQIATLEGKRSRSQELAGGADPPPKPAKEHWEYVLLYAWPSGELVRRFPAHNEHIEDLDFSPDGKRLTVVGHPDPLGSLWDAEERIGEGQGVRARVWEVATGKPLAVVQVGAAERWQAFFGPRLQNRVLVNGQKPTIYDLADGKIVCSLPEGTGVGEAAFSHDGKLVAIPGTNWAVDIYDATTGRHLRELRGHVQGINDLAFAPDDARVVSASSDFRDMSVKVWNPRMDAEGPTFSLPATVSSPVQLIFPVGGKAILAVEPLRKEGSFAATWLLPSGESKPLDPPLELGAGIFMNATLSDDGRTLAAQFTPEGKAAELRFWSMESGKMIRSLPLSEQGLPEVHVRSPDLRTAITVVSPGNQAAADDQMIVWNLADGTRLRSFPTGRALWVRPAVMSRDGSLVACRSYAGFNTPQPLLVYDVVAGKLVCELDDSDGYWSVVEFSPDGKRLVAAATTGWRLWDLATGKLTQKVAIPGTYAGELRPDGPPAVAALSRDGRRLATTNSVGGYSASRIFLWDVATGQQLLNLPAPDGYLSFRFSPDDRRLVIEGYGEVESYVRIWDGGGR